MFKYLVVFLLLVSVTVSPALASAKHAEAYVHKLSKNVITIISNEKYSTAQKEEKLSKMFLASVDVDWIAKFAMGRYWRKANRAQQTHYLKLYREYLVKSYVPRFREYNDQTFQINKSSSIRKNEYTVETAIIDKEGKSLLVNYKVKRLSNGRFRIFDIVAEGVSLITTHRSEFNSVLSRKGIDDLLAKLEKKVALVRKKSNLAWAQ